MSKILAEQVLNCAIKKWEKSQVGASSLEVSRELGVPNWKVKAAMLTLEKEGKCKLNKDAKFFPMNLTGKGTLIPSRPTLAHVLFPLSEVLEEHFHNSGKAREELPIYKARLLKGAQQYEHAVFDEAVLKRYLDHPELYDVSDALDGGSIRANTDDEDTHIYVRHGRRQLANGRSAVLAVLKDLAALDESQQRYWHGFEIKSPHFADSDPNFDSYMQRTFDGAFNMSINLIELVEESIKDANRKSPGRPIFRHTTNPHLQTPLENTEKAFYDSCSELFKLIGPDSLVAASITSILVNDLSTTVAELEHKGTDRQLSTFQQLKLIETKTGMEPKASKIMEEVRGYRTRADHAIVTPTSSTTNYVEKFQMLCEEVAYGIMFFATKLEAALAEATP